MNIWLLLAMILDVCPWLILQYLPFRKKLRCSESTLITVQTAVLLLYQGAVACFGDSLGIFAIQILRVAQFLVVVMVFHWLVEDSFVRKAFVVGMLFPLTVFVSSIGAWCITWMPWQGPDYMIPALTRLVISAALYPVLYRFWRWKLIPVLEGPCQEVFHYCWPLTAVFTVATVLSLRVGAEVQGTSLTMVLVRLAIFLGIVYVNQMAVKLSDRVERRIRMEEEVEKNWLLIGTKTDQYESLTERLHQTEEARNNMKLHLSVLASLAEEDRAPHVKAYIEELSQSLEPAKPQPFCENCTANAVLTHYAAQARQKGVRACIQADIPQDLGINGTDLCIVLGCLFENAIEAVEDLPPEQRTVEINVRTRRGYLKLEITNPFQGEIRQENGKMLSKKLNFAQPGVGLTSVWAMVDRYNGELRIQHDRGVFTVYASLEEEEEKDFGKF